MAKVLKLIEKHMLLWDLKRRLDDLGQRPGRHIVDGVAYGPCLVLSRERGSGGGRIAQLVGERLGWQIFDREILQQIAELAHIRLQLIASVDEQTRSCLENNWNNSLRPETIPEETYIRCLRQVVMTLAHHGDVVLVGRGANYLVPTRCALRVRVVAPLELRVERLARRAGLSLPQAQAQVKKFDSERVAFVQRHFLYDATSPLNYDVVVNTEEMTFEPAAELILTGLRDKLGVDVPRHAFGAKAA